MPIHKKLNNFKTKLTMNHEINMKEKKYTIVYITSDIHADIRKLLSLLIDEGIISIDIKGFKPYTDDIYNKPFIENITFNHTNMLFIILGDLIDGCRKGFSEVDDPIGNFELILHIFLFNMRLKAREQDSEVLFTIGNHDYNGIIFQNGARSELFEYRHNTSLNYFAGEQVFKTTINVEYATNGVINKKYYKTFSDALLPFYELSPYFILFLKNDEQIEFKCIHAGFHNSTGNNNTDELITLQKEINKTGLLVHAETNTNYLTLLGADTNTINPNGGLWSRAYATIECNTLKANDTNENTTIVVGHCPTNHTKSRIVVTKDIIAKSTIEDTDKQPNYLNCNKSTDISKDSKGCVVADCFTNLIPKLIFVDTAMSEAFRTKQTDANIYRERGIEFLLLEYKKENEKQNPIRWINTISRKPAGKANSSKKSYPNYNPIQLYPRKT